jgi:hypothetical protein
LHELFGADDASAPPTLGCRKYVLEYLDGEPEFRPVDSGPVLPRDEVELAVEQIIDEELSNDIVPQKLMNCFPTVSASR